MGALGAPGAAARVVEPMDAEAIKQAGQLAWLHMQQAGQEAGSQSRPQSWTGNESQMLKTA